MSLDPLLNPGNDFLGFDFIELGTYRVRGAGEKFTDVTNVHLLHRQGMVDEPNLAGKEATTWHILASELTADAKPRDRVKQTNGVEWEVVDVNRQTFDTRFKLSCIRCR